MTNHRLAKTLVSDMGNFLSSYLSGKFNRPPIQYRLLSLPTVPSRKRKKDSVTSDAIPSGLRTGSNQSGSDLEASSQRINSRNTGRCCVSCQGRKVIHSPIQLGRLRMTCLARQL